MNAVVTLTVESVHTYFLPDVTSLEEAETIAAQMLLEDEDEGDDVDKQIVDTESFEDDDDEPEEN